MNKLFYTFGIFIISLYVAFSLFQTTLYFYYSNNLYSLASFLSWSLVSGSLNIAGSLVLIVYFHQKKYHAVFVSAILAALAYLCHYLLAYKFLSTKEASPYYVSTHFISLAAGIIQSVILIFSDTRHRPLLRTTGIFGTILGVIIVLTMIALHLPSVIKLNGNIGVLIKWLSVVSSLFPLMYVMNFASELKALPILKHDNAQQEPLKGYLIFTGVIFLCSTVFFGSRLFIEANQPFVLNKVSEHAKMTARPFDARTYITVDKDTLLYRLLLPLNYDPTKKYPMVVCLHGGAGWGSDNTIQVEASWPSEVLSKYENRIKYPAFLFVPQCPTGSSWGGLPQYPSIAQLVFETMASLETEFTSIDTTRRYVSGNSLGGFGTWHFITLHPTMFAAAIPISGVGDPTYAKEIVNVPVWAFHGKQDNNVPVSGSQDIINTMKKEGGTPQYTEFPDSGHDIWRKVEDTPGVLDWLFAQQRNP